MAESGTVRNKRDVVLSITDGSETYTISKEPGDFSLTVPGVSVEAYLDRGAFGATPDVRNVDDQPMTYGWTTNLRDLGDTAEPETYQTLPDILFMYAGGYTLDNWASTLGANTDTYTFTTNVVIDGDAFGESDKTIALPFSALRGGMGDGSPLTIPTTGTSYAVAPVIS